MKPKLILCLALVLMFFGVHPNLARSQTNSVIEEWEKDRVATIELQIYLDFQDYSELNNYLAPDHFSRGPEPDEFSVEVDSSVLQQGIIRQAPDGRIRMAGENDYIYLRISAGPGTARAGKEGYSRISAPTHELLRENLPGTEMSVTVEAASKDKKILRRLRDSLAKLPPKPDSAVQAVKQLELVKKSVIALLVGQIQKEATSFHAADTLIRLQFETPVIDALTNANRTIRRDALYALANESVSEAAVPPLVSLLKTNDSELCVLAMSALARIHKGNEIAVPALMPFLHDGNSSIRQTALAALCAFKVPAIELLPTFTQLLGDTNVQIRSHTMGLGFNWAMANDESAKVIPAMISLLEDSDNDVRLSTISVLGQIMNQKLRGGAHPYPWDAIRAKPLGKFEPQANLIVTAIIQSLSDTNAAVRAAAADALGDMGPFDKMEDEKIVAALIRALADENKDVRLRTSAALINFGAEAKDAIPVLAGLTNQGGLADEAIPQIKAAVYKSQLDEILRQKYPRLDEDAAPVQMTDSTHWTLETNTLPGIKSPPLLIKRASFRMRAMGQHPIQTTNVDFIAFKAPQSGKIWIGWDMDFYVETDSTIIGGMLPPWGEVYWHEDLAEPAEENLDAAIQQFEQRVNASKIKGESRQQTDIRNPAKPAFFSMPGTGQEVMPKFLGVQVNGATMELDLENPETGGIGNFWIDVKTRKILKMIEKDK
ncbi:MAG TPA: HEAT repeat domain-containing protein [Verrucomicrobiae bacterium]